MIKIVLILDFDNTICKSNKAILTLASMKDGKEYNESDITDYSFSNVLKHWDSKDIDNMFISEAFYEVLEPFENAIEVIKKLKEDGSVIKICTITRLQGIIHKGEWIKEKLGKYIDEVIYIDNYNENGVKMCKDSISGDLLLDDHTNNLNSANVTHKIAFGEYVYNKDWNGLRAKNWNEFYNLVCEINGK